MQYHKWLSDRGSQALAGRYRCVSGYLVHTDIQPLSFVSTCSMSPSKDLDQTAVLRERVTELEEVVQHQRQRIQMSESRFHRLMETVPVMMWMSGPDGLCTFFNHAWLDFRGRTLEAECGNGWADGLHPDDRNTVLEKYLKSFSSRQPFRLQYRVLRGSGDYGWIENSAVPLAEDDGAFSGFLGAAVDITDRKRGMFVPDEESMRLVFSSDRTRTPGAGADRRWQVHQGSRRHNWASATKPRIRIAAGSSKNSAFTRPPAWCGMPSGQA